MKFSFFKRPKVQVFVRYCYYSDASAHKNRPKGFSHEKCFLNLIHSIPQDKVQCTFLLDTHYAKKEAHFIQNQMQFPIIEIDAGEEGKSFLALLDYVIQQDFSNETILYFLEDDYIHRQGWADILLEGFSLPQADYITLFDHRDKYDQIFYQNLSSQLFYTPSCHWRTTPSTTNTYAMRMKTLKDDLAIHKKFSEGVRISKDHEKFLSLRAKGRVLLSAIPGWSTHCEPDFASPCIDWSGIFSMERVK